jgi:hypothetical protein
MTCTPGGSSAARSLNQSGSGNLSGRGSAGLTSYSSESPPGLHHSTTAATPAHMFYSNANANAGATSSKASVRDLADSMAATSLASQPTRTADSSPSASASSAPSSSSSSSASFLACAASPYGPAVGAIIRQRSKSTRRRFIGQGEWASLSQLTEFTEPELERLHAVFCARQTNGMLAQAPFWRVVAETHGFFAPSDDDDDDGDGGGGDNHDWARAAADSASQSAGSGADDDRAYLRVYLDENSLLAARMYSIFDVLKFGSLTFLEFVLAFAVMCARSTFLDRVTFAFDVFDLQQDQRVSADELHMCAATVNIALALAQQQRDQQPQPQQPPPPPQPQSSGSSTPSSASLRSPSRSSPSASASAGRSSSSAAAASPKVESHAAAAQRLAREAAAIDRVARLYERALQSTRDPEVGAGADTDGDGHSVGKDAFRRMVEAHPAILEPFACTFDQFCRNVPLVSEL